MAQDHNDIYTIVEKLAILEGRLTPTTVKNGLNPQQRSVPQMPALFKAKTQKILGGDADEKNPMSGYAVGGCEESIREDEVAEDILEKVKRSFTDFIKNVEDEIKDSDLKDKNNNDTDLKSKDKKDRDLIAKHPAVTEDPTEEEPNQGSVQAPEINPTYAESAPIKTVNNECGLWEMHGNEHTGFEIRRGGRCLPTRFNNLDEAEMAVEMFTHRRLKTDDSQDYMEER